MSAITTLTVLSCQLTGVLNEVGKLNPRGTYLCTALAGQTGPQKRIFQHAILSTIDCSFNEKPWAGIPIYEVKGYGTDRTAFPAVKAQPGLIRLNDLYESIHRVFLSS